MHNPKCILENKTQKILCDFEVQMDYIILARRPWVPYACGFRTDLANPSE